MIQSQLSPEIEAKVTAEAQARSLTPQHYLERLVAERIMSLAVPLAVATEEREPSMEQFRASLDRLTRHTEKIPSLPIAALSRESFYEDCE